jgi:hypothetical protein
VGVVATLSAAGHDHRRWRLPATRPPSAVASIPPLTIHSDVISWSERDRTVGVLIWPCAIEPAIQGGSGIFQFSQLEGFPSWLHAR